MDAPVPLAVDLHLNAEALDDVPFGLLRMSLDGSAAYFNRAMRELAGPLLIRGTSVLALPFTPESGRRLHDEFERRRTTLRGSDYPLELQRPDLGDTVRVQMRVAAVPDYDAAGRLLGSVGFVEDQTLERAIVAFHQAIGSASGCHDLLQRVLHQLALVIQFDAVIVSLVNDERDAIRLLVDTRPGQKRPWRWWRMAPLIEHELKTLTVASHERVADMFAREPYAQLAEQDPDTAAFIAEGWQHQLLIPVKGGDAVMAIVSLLRRDADRPFGPRDANLATHLPVGEAVNVALAMERHRAAEFELELIRKMSEGAASLMDVAGLLVEGLRAHRNWGHVSLFRVDREQNVVTLVRQSSDSRSALAEGHQQAIGEGVVGEVARDGVPLRIADVTARSNYRRGVAGTVSEMCLPVPGTPLRWIVNVESPEANAFVDEEERSVKRLLTVAGLILERTWALEVNRAVFESVADAVIQTSVDGRIQKVNPACCLLLGEDERALVGASLAERLVTTSDETAQALVARDRLLPDEVGLRHRDGTQIPVLLSGAALPPQIGGRVYVASDLRQRQAAERMDGMRRLYRQFASEIRVPLSLASHYLKHAAGATDGAGPAGAPATRDAMDKALRQIGRADIALERAVRLGADAGHEPLPTRPIDLAAIAERLRDELPERLQAHVAVHTDGDRPPVNAAVPELVFCAGSLLAFALRMGAERDRTLIRVGPVPQTRSRQMLSVELVDAQRRQSSTRLAHRGEQAREFDLGESIIRSLMQRMGGSLEVSGHDEPVAMRLLLPVMEVPS